MRGASKRCFAGRVDVGLREGRRLRRTSTLTAPPGSRPLPSGHRTPSSRRSERNARNVSRSASTNVWGGSARARRTRCRGWRGRGSRGRAGTVSDGLHSQSSGRVLSRAPLPIDACFFQVVPWDVSRVAIARREDPARTGRSSSFTTSTRSPLVRGPARRARPLRTRGPRARDTGRRRPALRACASTFSVSVSGRAARASAAAFAADSLSSSRASCSASRW